MWHDLNANGVQDAGEPGVGGVTVQLLSQAGAVVATTGTDSTGKYLFANVVAGTYSVMFQKPSGFSFTPVTTQGSKVTNVTTGATATFTVVAGQTITTIGAGLFQGTQPFCFPFRFQVGLVRMFLCSFQPNCHDVMIVMWCGFCVNHCCVQAVYPCSKILIIIIIIKKTRIDDSPFVIPGGSIGNRAWHDTNGNGIQDAGEPGLGGVTVELRQGPNVIATTTTDANGNAVFVNVVPGTYTAVIQRPSGYTFTPVTNQDSKVIDFVTGSTSPITITSGQTITTINAGLYQGMGVGCRLVVNA